jgi:hypothetical protein
MAVIADFKQLFLNIKSCIDDLVAKDAVLEESIGGLVAVPNITDIVCNPAVNPNLITVTLDKPARPVDGYSISVKSIRDGSVQLASFSPASDYTVWNVITSAPVVLPFLVVVSKSS